MLGGSTGNTEGAEPKPSSTGSSHTRQEGANFAAVRKQKPITRFSLYMREKNVLFKQMAQLGIVAIEIDHPVARKLKGHKHLESGNKRPMGVKYGKRLSDRLPIKALSKKTLYLIHQ